MRRLSREWRETPLYEVLLFVGGGICFAMIVVLLVQH